MKSYTITHVVPVEVSVEIEADNLDHAKHIAEDYDFGIAEDGVRLRDCGMTARPLEPIYYPSNDDDPMGDYFFAKKH